MKKLLYVFLFSNSVWGMSPNKPCGFVENNKHFSPNEYISELNKKRLVGICPIDSLPNCPYRCKSYYTEHLLDTIVKLIESLYNDKLIDIDLMEYELLSLKNDRNAAMIEEVIARVKEVTKKSKEE